MTDKPIQNVAIVGAGFIGPGIAQIFAFKGYTVYLMDVKAEMLPKAIDSIRANLGQLAEAGILDKQKIEEILSNIRTTTEIRKAVEPAQLVIEAVTENMALKQKIFVELDQICPVETILCTNTSVMSITEIASQAQHRERIVGTHFWNPPFLIPLVEVVKGNETTIETLERTYHFLKEAGKHPVKCMKDVPGFIANRLQHALWREAISIVENGIADARTVDEAIKNSFAVRLPVLGPLENSDMIGTELTFSIHDYVLKYLEDSHEPSPLLKMKIQKGELGFKTGKGFYDLAPGEAQAINERLNSFLIRRLKENYS